MTFNGFIENVRGQIKNYLPSQYEDADVTIDTINKTSERYTGMIIRPEGAETAPVINMDRFYAEYLQNENMEEVLSNISEMLLMAVPPEINSDIIKDYDQLRDSLFVRISPLDGSEPIMAVSPHRVQDDLLMTYHIFIPAQDGGFMSARITTDMLNELGVDAKKLHEDAILNTARIMPPKVQSMSQALFGVEEEAPKMIVITNENGALGAGALFCEGVMDQVSEKLKCQNYYLLPSSVHEWIAVPDDGSHMRTELEEMVKSANSMVVEPEDKLSDNVFHYDSQERLFERADKYESRVAVMAADKVADRGSLLGKLQDKKEHVDIGSPAGTDMKRQMGLAI